MSTSIIAPTPLSHDEFSSVSLDNNNNNKNTEDNNNNNNTTTHHGSDMETDSLNSQGYTTSDATDEMTRSEDNTSISQDTVKEGNYYKKNKPRCIKKRGCVV